MEQTTEASLAPIQHTTVDNELNDLKSMVSAIDRSQAVVEFDLNGKVMEANQNFLALTGYSLAEIRGKHHRLFCDETYANSPEYRTFWENLCQGDFQVGEFKRLAKGGREVWIVATYNPILGKNGKPVKIVKFATDVTATMVELKVRTDIMNLTSIVSESDLRGDIMSVNDKFCEISKYRKDELVGKPHNTTRHPDMPKEVFKELWATIGRGKMFRGIIKNRAKDGTPYYVDAVVAPIMGENGKPRKYLGVRYDITEAEIERQNMKGIFRAIDSSYAFIEFDVSGNITSANKVFQAAMGYSADELKGKHHRIFCDPALVTSPDYAQFWSDLKAGQSKIGVFNRVTKSGKRLWLQAVYSPVTDETGRVVKVVKFATDVSDMVAIKEMVAAMGKEVASLTTAASELTSTATQMAGTANTTSNGATTAAANAEEVAAGIQTVATNIEEMVASIKEIGRSTSESSQMTKSTLAKTEDSNAMIIRLGTSSQEIGEVIKVISSIAQQTNLLALNATIEAARAGEAGKGFAVVANEVKELAKQTAKATSDITNRISSIQNDTKQAVEAMAGISQSVEKLNGISGVIAAAVEEQTATSSEISRVVLQSKKSVENIASTIKTVSLASNENTKAASHTLSSASELTLLAEKLSAVVKQAQK